MQAIKGVLQSADKVLLSRGDKTRGLLKETSFHDGTVEVSTLDV
jgi:hypothetical protein